MITNSIRRWLTAPLLFLFVVPLLILGAFLSWHNSAIEKEQIKESQQRFTNFGAHNIEHHLGQQENIIRSFLSTNYLPDMATEKLIIEIFTLINN